MRDDCTQRQRRRRQCLSDSNSGVGRTHVKRTFNIADASKLYVASVAHVKHCRPSSLAHNKALQMLNLYSRLKCASLAMERGQASCCLSRWTTVERLPLMAFLTATFAPWLAGWLPVYILLSSTPQHTRCSEAIHVAVCGCVGMVVQKTHDDGISLRERGL